MEEQSPPDVTQLLLEWRNGDASALQRLMPLVYDELRRLARRCLRRERAGHTMQTTALVHEAYLRLIDANRVPWEDRAHFFAIAAQLMRRVLVDEARKRNFQKRGGAFTRISLDEAMMVSPERDAELLALDEALHRLGQFAPRKCRVVELRFFAGLSIEETATALSLSTDIVKREWRTAKLWLLHDESLWRGFLRKRYSTLVTGEDGGIVQLWTPHPLNPTAVIGHHSARIKSVAFSPDGNQVASAGDDKMIALWDVSGRKLITRIGLHTVYAIAISPDGRQLVSGGHDRSVRLYTRHRTLWGFRLN